jgi:hypothetical protein
MQEFDLTDAGELRARIARRLRGLQFMLLTTSDGRGQLRSRPLALVRTTRIGELWVAVDPSSEVIAEVRHDPRVNLSCMDAADGFYLSISGIARPEEIVTPHGASAPVGDDSARRGAAPAPLLKVEVNRAHMWSAPSRLAPEVLSFARSALTGGPQAPGRPIEIRL